MTLKSAASFCLLFTAAMTSLSFPQLSLSARFENYYDDNIYNNFEKTSDLVHSGSLDAGYDFESETNNFQLYYTGNMTYFRDNSFKSSNSHKFGIVNTYFVSEEANPLNAGINYALRNNRDELSVYDLSQLSAYANYRHFLNETDYLLTGYLFFFNDYKNFNSFTHYEHRGFVKYSNTFSGRTTLSLGTEMDFKLYKLKYNTPDIADNVSQWKSYIQLAQNLSESTGLSGYFLYRKNLTTGNRYITYTDYIYYEEEIFNDAYSNDGIETGAALTQLISESAAVRAEFTYIQRNFNNLPVALADGTDTEILRKDNYYALGAELHINLSGITEGLGLSLNYNYLMNKSNDYFYDYDNNLTSVTLEWGF
jgi:hypothetical protein